MGKKEESSKRKIRERKEASEVLLDKSNGDRDELNITDDLNEPTMGEKLASLNLGGSDKAPNHETVDSLLPAKPPSTDSLYILLKQALRADDRALLIDCLYRKDEKVIPNSLALLKPSDVLKFLKFLVPIIPLRGAVLACALPWLRSLLFQHAGSIMFQESSLAALNSLYQTFGDGVEENVVTPVIYEDEDESNDEGSEDSMEVDTVQDGEEPPVCSDISDDKDNAEISD